MSAQIISGKELSSQIRAELKDQVSSMSKDDVLPGLAVVLVGDDPASQVYVNNKEKACKALGMYSEVHRLPASATENELLALVQRLNENNRIHGILVQMPLPDHISEQKVIHAIDPAKDVDGFHPVNVGKLMIGEEALTACTPAGIIEMLKRSGIEIAGKRAVVVGRSNIVGKPISMLLLHEHATVTICHSRTPNLAEVTREADILITAVGRPNMITKQFVKPGSVVIDVGINRMPDGKLAGDVDFESVKEIAGYITPVPGGVGPMTITMLMRNTVKAAQAAARAEG